MTSAAWVTSGATRGVLLGAYLYDNVTFGSTLQLPELYMCKVIETKLLRSSSQRRVALTAAEQLRRSPTSVQLGSTTHVAQQQVISHMA
eukprot:1247015-Amphidinium_carterae.3